MKKILFLTKMLLAAALLCVGQNAWAAATRTLTEDYAVAGYKMKAYYDLLTSNVGTMCPTSGDARYRDSYGLFNFGKGSRSGDITISVSNGDLIIFEAHQSQTYDDAINSVSSCTKNETVSTGSYWAYDVTSDATSLTVNIARAEYVSAILVMEKDNTVETADFTINYLLNGEGEPVKTSTGNMAVGATVNTDASFFVGDVKYFRADGQAESVTIASGDNTFNISVRLAATYNYSLQSSLGETLASGTGLEGETVSVGYPRYQLKDGVFYEAGVTNKEYRKPIVLSSDNASATVTYTAKEGVENVAFYAEGESIEGMNESTTGNISIRASNAKASVASEDVTITTLPAGKYVLHVGAFTSKSSEQKIYIGYGETQYAFASSTNLNETESAEFTLTEETDIKYFGTTSSENAQFDYIYIVKTGEVATIGTAGWATLYTPYALDFSGVAGLTAYTATCSDGTVTLTPVVNVPANTGVVLKGAADTYSIPVAASSSTAQGHLKGSATEATAYNAFDGYTLYVLTTVNDGANVQFNPVTEGSIAAGKAFLKVSGGSSSARALRVVFDGITGVANVEAAAEAKAQEGKFIENGKIVIVKNGVKYNAAGQQVK